MRIGVWVTLIGLWERDNKVQVRSLKLYETQNSRNMKNFDYKSINLIIATLDRPLQDKIT